MAQGTIITRTYSQLLSYCEKNDVLNAEKQFNMLLNKDAPAVERYLGARRMNEVYIGLRDYDKAE